MHRINYILLHIMSYGAAISTLILGQRLVAAWRTSMVAESETRPSDHVCILVYPMQVYNDVIEEA
jgi:hypothetical protein